MNSWNDVYGEKVLNTVRTDVRHPFDADASGVCLYFNDMTVFAFEDPSDGYRSCCSGPLITTEPLYYFGVSPEYIRADVLVREWSKGRYGGEASGIEIIDRANGKTILLLGTDNSDDYYPSFTCEWSPQNLAVNDKGEKP